jgi:transposase-like protein
MSKLSAPHFTDEEAARVHLEAIRWPSGPVCPHCGSVKKPYTTKRAGKYRCSEKECRKDFTVKVGTVFESSHIPLHKWLLASYLLCSSKKGISSHQLSRLLDVTYKSAWFMTHRIRAAMRTGSFSPVGGSGKVVEADETYIGIKAGHKKARSGYGHKRAVLSLVERRGEVRSFHVDQATVSEIVPLVRKNVSRESHLMTDESRLYWKLGEEFIAHDAIEHGKDEYVRGDIHTNTVEGYFSIFKRGMKGIYQHRGEKHLHRYLAEFDFRYNNRSRFGIDDTRRADIAMRGIEGKRLTYRRINGQEAHG